MRYKIRDVEKSWIYYGVIPIIKVSGSFSGNHHELKNLVKNSILNPVITLREFLTFSFTLRLGSLQGISIISPTVSKEGMYKIDVCKNLGIPYHIGNMGTFLLDDYEILEFTNDSCIPLN